MTAERQNKAKKKRDRIGVILYCFYAIVLVAGFFIIGKMVCIQLFWKPDKDVARFFLPPSTKSVIEPDRGAIIGCDGKLLAMSTPMYQLYMDCTVLKSVFRGKSNPDSLERDWLSKAKAFSDGLAKEVGGSAGDYYRMIVTGRKDGNRYMRLTADLDRGALLRLQKLPLMKEGRYKSGIIVNKRDSRQYPYGTLARRTIGYVKDNRNSNGNNHIGLEGKYDYALHGKEGEIWLRPTDNRERIQNYDSTYVKPEDGLNVRTTLNITLQDIVDKAMRKQMAANPKINEGCAVIMDVKTGAIRSMVNLTKDPKDSSLNEVYNMAIGFAAEPGSVFKATTLMTVIEDGFVKSLDDVIPMNNGVIPGYPQDTHIKGNGEISVLRGFEISSNYVFRYLAVKNYNDNPKRFLDKLYMYKLGQAFDFDLKGLSEPYIPSPDSKQWSATDLGSTAIGYSVKETPLHILTFYNAIANKGRMMKPYLVESIEKNGAVKTKKGPSVLNASICSKATADTMLRAMRAVTSEGTAKRLKGAKLTVAGKTGTSRQVLSKEEIDKYGMSSPYVTKDGSYHNLATFVGFFPAENPKYSAIVCMKSDLIRGSLYGGVGPAAVMREVVDAIYVLDPEWGNTIISSAKVPQMKLDREIHEQADTKNPVVPDVTGLGLKDAMFIIENSGLRCRYTGTGHVTSQTPSPGAKATEGSAITLTLK
ncbi:MAG: penicillin-binding protein [Candidatus Cryptobacteroides sp.]|nr:penicillin-binding protein [Candidatus Cryptobacteroides sp.]MDY5199475.1 penicillin-binding protein [Candidatus Cryptobacteroides sp.]